MRTACFTVDLDRDVNFMTDDGRALSLDRGNGTAPRFSSSVKGTEVLTELFSELGIKGTFFAESTALKRIDLSFIGENEIAMHGRDHEDITAFNGDIETMLSEASDSIKDITGKRPVGFRAPFMKINDEHYKILERIGIRYDSSVYSSRSIPYRIGNIIEFPVTEGNDRNGKRITSYLWPMHEGSRSPEDLIDLASNMNDGVFVIATHTWHMVESRKNGIMSGKEAEKNKEDVKKIVSTLSDLGYEFRTMGSLSDEI